MRKFSFTFGRASLILAAALFVSAAAVLSGCTASGQSAKDANEAPKEETSSSQVNDDPPLVDKCHTDSGSCALSEPMLPGLGCFCDTEQGRQAGNAGS